MTTLDPLSLMAAHCIVTIVCGALFTVDVAARRGDRIGRVWSAAFVFGMLATLACYGFSASPKTSFLDIAWVVASLLAGALFWFGARLYNGRTSGALVALVLIVVLIAIVVVPGEPGLPTRSFVVSTIGMAVFAALTVVESLSGYMKYSLHARVLAAGNIAYGAFLGVLGGLAASGGETSLLRESAVLRAAIPLAGTAFVVLQVVLLSQLQSASTVTRRREADALPAFLPQGGLRMSTFEELGRDVLARGVGQAREFAFLRAELDNLFEINMALGRDAGDRAIENFAEALRAVLPPTALIGYERAGRFVVLSAVDEETDGREFAADIHQHLIDRPWDQVAGTRLSASFGISDTFIEAVDFAVLADAAETSLDGARASGLNTIGQRSGGL